MHRPLLICAIVLGAIVFRAIDEGRCEESAGWPVVVRIRLEDEAITPVAAQPASLAR